MVNTKRLLKVSAAWISIVYVICFLGIALFPNLRFNFPRYGLHMILPMGMNVVNFSTFISGLVIWNVIAFVAVWLFATLYNNIKE